MVPGTQRRVHLRHNTPAWAALLRGLAILSLLFLPTSFRGGAEAAHAHTFFQLWADAADGHVDHHRHSLDTGAIAENWLDPRVEMREDAGSTQTTSDQVDTGSHEDSAPVTAGVHLLIAMVASTVPPPSERVSVLTTTPPLMGMQPAVLSPPPR